MGGKSSTSTSSVTIPPEVLARYNAVNARAEAAANAPYKAFGDEASDYVAQMNAQQNAGIAGINATVGSYQPYFNEAGTATRSGMGPAYEGIDNYMSPYIKNVADTTGAYMRQQQEQAQSGALGNAISSGAFGGDRAGIAAANLQQQNQMGYGKTMADIMNQGYTQALGASQADLARQMAGGAQLASLGAQSQQLGLQGAQAQLAAGTMQQQTEQAGKDAMINRFMQEQGYPFQVAQFLANIAMGTGAAQGSTTVTETPRSIFGFAQGGGVAGPRTYSQGTIGGEGYVPVGDLPVGQLMTANPPEQAKDDSVNKILELIKMVGGAKNGGAIDQRHGYADGGSPFTDELRRQQEIRDAIAGLGLADRARSEANTAAAMGQQYSNPANSMAPPVVMPNAVSGLVAKPQSVGPEEAWDVPIRGGQTEPREVPFRSGPTGLDTPVRGGMTQPEQPFRSGLVPFRSNPAMGGPGTFATGEMPFPHPQQRPEGLGYQPTMPIGGPGTIPSGLMPESLAPVTSPRPQPRPLPIANVEPMRPNGGVSVPAAPDIAAVGPQSDTGVVPQGGYRPIIPLKTQLQFVTAELQQPQYRGYLEQKYATPEEAAVQFESIYEGAGGAGNDVAAANARGIFDAARNGNLDSLPPNVAEAYNHFVHNGMDPVQAAGATGRLMVESYARLDPNARNTLGGGNGTFGVAQWRGSRMEDLAKFAGVPLDVLTNAPVSTPEGRYYSTGAKMDSGLGGADMAQQQGVKPYEDRNMIGKFFHDPVTGKLNPNAIMSLLSGIGAAAQAPTISPIGALLAGVGAGSDTYKQLLKQNADIGFTKAQTATEAVQLLKNSIYYDQNLGMSVIPLAGGGQQSLADFVVNPAGPSMAGPEADAIIRSIAGGANSRGVDLATATPEQIFSVAPPQTSQGAGAQPPAAGMPVPLVVTPHESFGTFPLGNAEQAYIAQAESRSRSPMTAPEREASIARSEASRAAADAGTASASLAFRNTNELAATVAKAAAGNDLGPLGNVIATYENLASQVAGMVGIEYDGTAASSQALLNKLSTLSADQMTADTAAASLYLQNKNIFPDIKTNPTAAAEITAEMLTKNMYSYEKGQYINDLYRAQRGVVKDLTGAEAMFNKQAGSIFQGEKANIADLLKYAGNAEADPEVKQLVVEFFDSANRGAFKDQADAQAALEAIFTVLPGQHSVSSGLGRYFVQ